VQAKEYPEILATGDETELQAAGFSVGTRFGPTVTVETEVEILPALAALASVRGITASTRSYPNNDLARRAIALDSAAGQRLAPRTGRGVIVGIIDGGIDFRHLDFTRPGSSGRQTRIKALLDMTVYSPQSPPLPPDPNWDYVLPDGNAPVGRLYTEADINVALQGATTIQQRDMSGHGTHVAGNCGRQRPCGAGRQICRMALEADLIIVKASRQSDGNDSFIDVDQINALAFIRQQAAQLGEPFVLNMSMSGHAGPHDGTRANERAIDELVSSGAGRAVGAATGLTSLLLEQHHAVGWHEHFCLDVLVGARLVLPLLPLTIAKEEQLCAEVARKETLVKAIVLAHARRIDQHQKAIRPADLLED
jgi:subtilisin family serine protease